MRSLAALLLLASASGIAAQPYPPAIWSPTAPYVTIGQDEPGYRNWYLAAPWHPAGVSAFNAYLVTYGVGGVVPTWQLLRTASDWQKCGAAPFEIPPATQWPNIVQTLRFVRDRVIPVVGPVEPVSVYRNPHLNICAGGAMESAHRYVQAVDMVPLRPITRETLIRNLCTVHAQSGSHYGVGLGFYPWLRFHIDSRSFRNWGAAGLPEAAACRSAPRPVPEAQKPPEAPRDFAPQ